MSQHGTARNDPTSPHMVGDLGFDPLGHGIPVDPSRPPSATPLVLDAALRFGADEYINEAWIR